MTITTWLALGEALWVVGLSGWIILDRRTPAATLAWIFALAWMPVLGIFVYLLVGPRRLHRKKLRYRWGRSRLAKASRNVRPRGEEIQPERLDATAYRSLVRLAEHAGQAPPRRARQIDVLDGGVDCYTAMQTAIEAAEHHVHLEYYIWEPDAAGTRFRDLLCRKAAQGVEVRLLVDAIGSAWLSRRFLRPLRRSGAEVAWFNPISWARFRPDLMNFRTHRKIVICDGHVGFLGGINICDDHCGVSGRPAWRDTHLRIEGPPVGDLQLAFLEDWYFAMGGAPCAERYFPDRQPASGPWVEVLVSGPDHEDHAIEKFCFASIAAAQRRVLVTTPYFVPNESLLSALGAAALRGVAVEVLVPRRSDSWLVTAAARSYFEELTRVGVKIYEYGPGMLHAKTLVVDDVALVGTANMDNRSFRLNFEIAAALYDAPLAQRLAEMFHDDLRGAERFRMRQALRTPLWQRMSQSAARLLSPLL